MKNKDLKNRLLLEDNEFKQDYLKKDWGLIISELVIRHRIRVGVTQEELANKISTKQSAVARLENGNHVPSINTLDKIAEALGKSLFIDFREKYSGYCSSEPGWSVNESTVVTKSYEHPQSKEPQDDKMEEAMKLLK
jgi:transcriptional regulator with XRE-family HTH domain